jgi:hypothetical protein
MKLQEICQRLHFDALKEPGLELQAIKDSNDNSFIIGNVFKVLSIKKEFGLDVIKLQKNLDNSTYNILTGGLLRFKKFYCKEVAKNLSSC